MVVTVKKTMNAKFLAYCFLSQYVLLDQLFLLRMRAAQPHLNAEELGETLILIPPEVEQYEIYQMLLKLDKEVNTVKENITKEIQILKEFKQILISNAVTGKIKI